MFIRDYRLFAQKLFVLIFSICCTVTSAIAQTDEELLKRAQDWIQQGNSIEAYDLLAPHEDRLAGNVDFDYLFGVAAMESGEPREAIFAFQRAITTDPNFAGARMELARAYFEIGELEQSEAEFRTILTQSPNKQTRDAIEKYLSAIENRSLAKSQGFHGYVLVGAGQDSNANNATASNTFLGFELAPQSREQSSTVFLAKAGFIYNLPVDYYRSYFVSANIGQRTNTDVSFTNSMFMDVTAGVRQSFRSGNFLGFNIQGYNTLVDGSFNNRGVFATGQFGRKFSADDQLTGYLRVGSIRFADLFETKDVDQAVTGLSWIHVFGTENRPSLNISMLYGVDEAVLDTSPYNRNFYGANISTVMAISHRWNLFALAAYIQSDFDDPFFVAGAEPREDSQVLAQLGASWYPSKVWSVQPVLRYIQNESNVTLYEYDKYEFLVTVRSDF